MTPIAATIIVGLSAFLLYIVEFAFIAKIEQTTTTKRMNSKEGR